MKLMIGGYAQGKLSYVLGKYQISRDFVWDAKLPESAVAGTGTVVFYRFHQWVKDRILEKGCPEEEIRLFLEQCDDCIIISDEIGNGIVPMDAFEREYRERTGKLLVWLAAQAEEVERVICGIGQKIK